MSKKVVLCHRESPMCKNAAAILGRIGYDVEEWNSFDASAFESTRPEVLVVDASCGELEPFYPYASPETKVVTLESGGEDSGLMGFIDLTTHLLRGFNVKLPELVMLINDLLNPQPGGVRRKPRVPAGFPCVVVRDGTTVKGYVFNLSEDGAFVEMEDPPPKGTRLHITMELPDPLAVDAQVMWRVLPEESARFRSPPGAGVSFVGLDEETRKRLQMLVSNKGRV